ncbi:MAG: ABC transporter ATP-binding protein, partial [Oscillospiraceae bacterium]|nr:ABC transporter ATP-binding protein [Oscillospiraceae bacterium]
QVISTTVMVTGITTMMFTLDWRLSVIALAMLGLICLMTYYLSSHGRGYFKTMQADISNLIGYTEETFAGQKVVKAFMHEPQTRKEFREYVEAVYESNRKTNAYSNMLMPINGNLSYMSYALIACIGAVFCIRGSLDIGTLASFLLYTRQLSQPISRLSQEFNYVMMALAGAERVFQLLDSPSEVDEGKVTMVYATENEDGTLTETDHRTGVWAWKDPRKGNALTRVRGDVRFNDVHFSYVPDKKVLGGISFYAKPGQKIAFVGSTGAGKTTITNLITRFYDVQQGTITYDGFNVQDIAKDSLRASIGMVLQHTNLFSGTVMDNIRYGRLDATDEECIAAAKLANADSFITRLPQGYDTMLTANGGNLSQGQRQLLNIARAAVASPPVLVLDEATSSIDTRTEHLIEAGMDEIMKGRTVFIIAHRLSTVQGSNAIMVIEQGSIVERGTHDELIAQKGRYYQLYTGTLELE